MTFGHKSFLVSKTVCFERSVLWVWERFTEVFNDDFPVSNCCNLSSKKSTSCLKKGSVKESKFRNYHLRFFSP